MAPRLRVRLSAPGRDESRALLRSFAGHAVLLVSIVTVDYFRGLTSRQPVATMRVGLAQAPPQASRPSPPPRRPKPTAPAATAPPVAPAEPEPEPEPERPGLEPPRETAPRASAPKPRPPRASAPRASAPAAAPESEPEPSAPGAAEAGAEASGIAASVEGWEGGPGDPYLGSIVRRVSGKWLKPTTGLPDRSATVYFEVDRRGRVSGIRLESPSGSPFYDRAALRAVEQSSPLPPIPAGVRAPSLKVHFEFLVQ